MTSRDKHNLALNVVGEGLWGFQANMILSATVLTVLLRSYGAGPRFIGSIAAVETAAVLLPQLLSAYIFTSRKYCRRRLILWHYAAMLPFVLVMGILTLLAARLSPAAFRWLMLLSHMCFFAAIGITTPAWVDWLARIFHVSVRGTIMGWAFFFSAFAGAGGGLAAAWVVARLPSPLSYACLFFAAYVFGMLSISMFAFVDDPAARMDDERTVPHTEQLLAKLAHSLADRNFREYLIGRILGTCGFSIMPFVALHYSQPSSGGLSEAAIIASGAAAAVGAAVGSLLLGRMGDRHGHRLGVVIGAGVQILSLVVMILLPGRTGCVIAFLTAGVGGMGTWVSHSNLMIETCPHDCRIAHISACNIVVGIVGGIMPLVAGMIVNWRGTICLFTVSAVLSVMAFLWLLLRVEEPRRAAAA